MSEDYEVKYWTERLGTTRDELQKIVDRVGNSANAVAKEFGGRLVRVTACELD